MSLSVERAPQNPPKRFVHQVCRRVIRFDSRPQRRINNGIDVIICMKCTLNNNHVMQMVPPELWSYRGPQASRVGAYVARVTDLTTTLTVERRSIENNDGRFACGNCITRLTLHK